MYKYVYKNVYMFIDTDKYRYGRRPIYILDTFKADKLTLVFEKT